MSTGEMQACLARFYVDEPFRKLFYLDARAALQDYRLAPEERAALLKLDHDLLDQLAKSLIAKRRKRIERAYPLLFGLGAADIRRYYARFYQLHPARPYQIAHKEVIDFGTFVEESLANADHLPPYASDLAKYERLYYWTAAMTVVDGDGDRDREPAVAVGAALDSRPFLCPDVSVADFAYDVGAIEEALQNGNLPSEVDTGGNCSIVFRPDTSTSRVRMLRINAPTKAVVDCCDGRRTVADIVTETEARFGAAGLSERIIESINRLLEAQVLLLDHAGKTHAATGGRNYASATQIESM